MSGQERLFEPTHGSAPSDQSEPNGWSAPLTTSEPSPERAPSQPSEPDETRAPSSLSEPSTSRAPTQTSGGFVREYLVGFLATLNLGDRKPNKKERSALEHIAARALEQARAATQREGETT